MKTGTRHQLDETADQTQSGLPERQNQTVKQSKTSAPYRDNLPSLSRGDFEPDYAALKYRRAKDLTATKMASGLGWFSIALGLAEILAPRRLGDAIGVGSRSRMLPAMGLREIASGIGILTDPRPAAAIWSRVGGDALDLALLGAALFSGRSKKGRVMLAIAAVAGVTALDYLCAQQLSENITDRDGNIMAPTTEGQSSGRRASKIL